eukprot:716941-Pleurochrysis_carterae.AAC.1
MPVAAGDHAEHGTGNTNACYLSRNGKQTLQEKLAEDREKRSGSHTARSVGAQTPYTWDKEGIIEHGNTQRTEGTRA